jgi:hypothetical protein
MQHDGFLPKWDLKLQSGRSGCAGDVQIAPNVLQIVHLAPRKSLISCVLPPAVSLFRELFIGDTNRSYQRKLQNVNRLSAGRGEKKRLQCARVCI